VEQLFHDVLRTGVCLLRGHRNLSTSLTE
jgi:hypothetical protein